MKYIRFLLSVHGIQRIDYALGDCMLGCQRVDVRPQYFRRGLRKPSGKLWKGAVRRNITPGVEDLRLPFTFLGKAYSLAEKQWNQTNGKGYVLVLRPVGISIHIEDGNANLLARDINDIGLTKTIYCIVNDCEEEGLVYTLLLPGEY